MRKNKSRRNWDLLSSTLTGLARYHSGADHRLREAARSLSEQLETKHVSHSNINTSGKVWGAKPLMLCFVEIFDQVLIEIFPEESLVQQELKKSGISLPLIEHLHDKEAGEKVALVIEKLIDKLEEQISFENNSVTISNTGRRKLLQTTENLELLMRILYIIDGELKPNRDFQRCEVCFRVASWKSNYCDLHNPKNDTQYRKGLKTRSLIPSQLQDKFTKIQAKQRSLRDDIILISRTTNSPKKTTSQSQALYADEAIINLVNMTLNAPWEDVSGHWDMVLDTVPFTKSRLEFSAGDCDSWWDFKDSIRIGIENYHMRISNPYWLFEMLAEAELWFSFEDSITPSKPDQKKEKILQMIRQGLRNKDIVIELGVSNSYVSELRKQFNKNRISN